MGLFLAGLWREMVGVCIVICLDCAVNITVGVIMLVAAGVVG